MLRSLLIGIIAGQRAMTPLALASGAARQGKLDEGALPSLLAHPVVAASSVALAGAEMAGDKMKTAPDRTVPIGLAVRSVTAAYAGAALAPRDKRVLGAAIAVGTAIASSYVGLAARKWGMRRYGQTATGFVEDAIVFGSGLAIANPALFSRER